MVDNFDIEEAHNNLRAIKRRTGNNIDGEVLYAALSLFTWAGMKKKEIVSAKIGDIDYNNDDDIIGININSDNNESFIQLFGHPKQVLTDYIQYLNNSEDYDTNPDSPFFPGYIGKSGERKLTRHLVNLGETYTRWGNPYEWELGHLKEMGRSEYYLKKKESEGYEENEALQEAAIQFRISKRQLKDSIDEIKQNSRDKSVKLSNHEDQMGSLDFSNEVEIEEYKKEGFRLINKLTRDSEKRLSMRQSFLSRLSKAREEFFRKQSEKKEPTQKLTYQEERDRLLEEFNPTIDNNSPNFDLDKRFSKEHDNDKDDQEKSDEDDQENPDKN